MPKLSNRCFCWFPSAMLVLIQMGTNIYGVSIQICINLGKTFLRISRIRNILLAWILARVFVYLPPFILPDSGLYLLNGFHFYFDLFWMAWHWKPAIRWLFKRFLWPLISSNIIHCQQQQPIFMTSSFLLTQSMPTTTVLFRTTFTRTIKLNLLL